MAEDAHVLVSMADIAQLAGRSRATVGNWKSRHADFPAQRGRNNRGPLYDRAEVVDWLQRTGRLDQRPSELGVIEELLANPYGSIDDLNDLPLILVVLALRKHCPAAQLQRFVDFYDDNKGDEFIHTVIPFADGVIQWESVLPPAPSAIVEAISGVDRIPWRRWPTRSSTGTR